MFENTNALYSFETTTYCNAACIMCPRDEFTYPIEHMTMDCFTKAVDESVALGVKRLCLCGIGEPLIDPYLEQRLAYIKAKYRDVEVSMVTTAFLLTEKMRHMVAKYVDVLKISNYGFTKETYEKVHGGSLKYEVSKRNIDEFLALEPSMRPYTILVYTVVPENEAEVKEWIEYYEPKCERIDVWKPHNWSGVSCDAQPEPHGAFEPCFRALTLSACVFRANGDVSVCCLDFNHNVIIGNIKDDSLEGILTGKKAVSYQQAHKNNTVLSSALQCKDCDQPYGRTDALIYSSDKKMKVGTFSLTSFVK